jgi:hypothetical protein
MLCKYVLPQPEGFTTILPLGPNFSIRAEAMSGLCYEDRIGPREGQNYAMGSETELLKRLVDRGEKIVYLPSAMVEHVVQAHQLEIRWLLGRSFRLGRGLTRMGFVYNAPSVRFLGVPSYMWPELVRMQMRYMFRRFFAWPRWFDIACEYQFFRGGLHEHRLMSLERRRRLEGESGT